MKLSKIKLYISLHFPFRICDAYKLIRHAKAYQDDETQMSVRFEVLKKNYHCLI